MKKIIIPGLLLVIANGFNTNVQAQVKPSERSFVAEMNKIKEKQVATNAKIRQMQKPSDSISAFDNNPNRQQVNTQVLNAATKTKVGVNANQKVHTPTNPVPQTNKLKPSERPLQKPISQ